MTKFAGIEIDYTRDSLFDELGLKRLKESYMAEDENSPQERFANVAVEFSSNSDHAQRLYDYASKHWLSWSTPILSYNKFKRGLGISCFLTYVEDTALGLVENLSETNWLSMLGGGVGIHFDIRSAGRKSTGVMSHMKTYDACTLAYKQESRRGAYAAYLSVDHPDIIPFLEMRKTTGDQNIRCLNMHHGINITNKFMQLIESCMLDSNIDDTWELIDPHSKKVIDKVSAKKLWENILDVRMQTGEPYLWFIDTANDNMPQYYKDAGLKINGSNLCSEIAIPTSRDRTAICCLSSVNAEYYDDWSKPKVYEQFIHDIMEMLDNVLNKFIENAPKTIQRAINSAFNQRDVGLGVLGFHAYLQKKNSPFEGAIAKVFNLKLFKELNEYTLKSSKRLAIERGEPDTLKNTGLRFGTRIAVAPNASTSIILGNTSPSIEPFRANAYRQDTTSGSFTNKNKFLNEILKEKFKEDSVEYVDIWKSIVANDGSVQHLDCLTEWQKNVFKTALEIDQRWIIEHAADRQQFIDQGQSLNLFFRPTVNILYLHAVHFSAWKQGLKGLYYCRSDKIRKADKIGQQIERKIIEELDLTKIIDGNECLACQ